MSTLPDGIDDGTGYAQTPGSSYALFPTALQKAAQMHTEAESISFNGLVKDGTILGSHQWPIQTVLMWIEIRADGDAPSGSASTVQVSIGGTLQSQVFSLTAGSNYSGLISVNGGAGYTVAAATTVVVTLVNGNGASDVKVRLHYQKVIL
ncbi:MAG TPA: hypothetical protein VMV72_18615 [Verrucomicrobiae bacterium]|nr:hypothetical protein [Verrucomicrobiae bacterium]